MDKQSKPQPNVRSPRTRAGVSSLEFFVSFSVMLVVMTFVTSLTFHVSQVWRDIEQDRLAMGELSNQLDNLTRQSKETLIEQTKDLKPSAFCVEGLPNPRLTANLKDSELGQRIDLTLAWDHDPVERKIHLSGWSTAAKPAANQSPKTKTEPEAETQPEPESESKPDYNSDRETEPDDTEETQS